MTSREEARGGPVRVAFVISHATLGGAEAYAATIVDRLGPDWIAGVAVLRDGPFVAALRARGVEVTVIDTPARAGGVLAAVRGLRAWPSLRAADVIHANGLKAALIAGLARIGSRTPVVWMKHDLAGGRLLSWIVAMLSSEVIAVSSAAAAIFPRPLRGRVHVVYDGIPDHDPDPAAGRAEACRLLGCEPDAEIVVHVGRVCVGKGQAETVEIAADVIRGRPSARFLLVGEEDPSYPGHQASLEHRIRELGLEDRVVFAGQRPDAVALIAGADVLLAPSVRDPAHGWSEGFGLVAAEAMWVGTPVVAYANGSLPEVLGDAAVLVGEGDRAALTGALVELLGDPGRRAALADTGRARARELFGIEDAVEALRARYRALAPSRRPGHAPESVPGLISVVIPAWGPHVSYVPGAVESLREQDDPAIEVVVADNASDPPVAGLPEEVRVVRTEERLTVGQARNFGLSHARGEHVMFWDADDLLLPGALERMRGVLESDADIVAVTMDSITWTPETGPGIRWPWPRAIMYRLTRHPRLFALIALLYNPFTTTGPALMRTASVRDAGGFAGEIAYLEDWALSASLTVRGRVVMLRESGRLYRVHDDSLSLGHLDSPQQGEWLRGIRERTRRDPSVPLWLKALLPLVRLHHLWREWRGARRNVGVEYYKSALEDSTSGQSQG